MLQCTKSYGIGGEVAIPQDRCGVRWVDPFAAIGEIPMPDVETAKETVKKAAKSAAAKFEAPKFDPRRIQVPEVFREMAEKSVEQAKDSYARLRSAAEDATDVVEDTYLQATRGATEFNLKAIDVIRENVNANLDYVRALLGVKSLSEAVEISTTHLREQFDALSTQAKEFSALAQKVAAETTEPLKSSASKTFKVN
jgi:phasin